MDKRRIIELYENNLVALESQTSHELHNLLIDNILFKSIIYLDFPLFLSTVRTFPM